MAYSGIRKDAFRNVCCLTSFHPILLQFSKGHHLASVWTSNGVHPGIKYNASRHQTEHALPPVGRRVVKEHILEAASSVLILIAHWYSKGYNILHEWCHVTLTYGNIPAGKHTLTSFTQAVFRLLDILRQLLKKSSAIATKHGPDMW